MLILNGQPILPSSAMAKSYALSSAMGARVDATPLVEVLTRFGINIVDSFETRYGTLFGVGMALMSLMVGLRFGPLANRLVVCLAVSFALMAHMLFGHFDWFARYEIYAMAMMFAALILLGAPFWRDTAHRYFFKTVGVMVFLTLLAADYTISVFLSPAAAHNIYVQQYQMHRFATAYFPHTVAVNDLGYVAYRNDNHVLDLWGLGSEEARLASTARGGRSPDFMRAMTTARDAKFAMIYVPWFKSGVPGEWCHIATLQTIKVSVGFADVQVYLIDRTLEAEMNDALDAFAPTLPAPDMIERFSCPPT